MLYSRIIAEELKRAKTGAKMVPVAKQRKPSAASLVDLEQSIAFQIHENDTMRVRSKNYAK